MAGCLMIVGGAEDKQDERIILRRFVDLAGGPEARVVVIPAASDYPEDVAKVYEGAFQELGVTSVTSLYLRTREEAQHPDVVELVRQSSGVFLTGGMQRKLMATLGGTDLARALHRHLRRQTGVIAGTSAGASAMTEHMIVEGRHGVRPRKGMLTLSAGLGFLPRIIVDQHFSERNRQTRLLATLAQNPYLLGVGVDEDTALLIWPGQAVEVLGEGSVTILDGRRMHYTNIDEIEEGEQIALSNVRLHLLTHGYRHAFTDTADDPLEEVLRITASIHP